MNVTANTRQRKKSFRPFAFKNQSQKLKNDVEQRDNATIIAETENRIKSKYKLG